MIVKPGALLRRERPGVLAVKPPLLSLSLAISLGPFADCCSLDSIICLCCSRTLKLRCSCSCIAGSWVTKPGDRHAIPTSRTLSPSRPTAGRAVCGPARVFFDRSSFLGRCLAGASGDGGSFLTKILGLEALGGEAFCGT